MRLIHTISEPKPISTRVNNSFLMIIQSFFRLTNQNVFLKMFNSKHTESVVLKNCRCWAFPFSPFGRYIILSLCIYSSLNSASVQSLIFLAMMFSLALTLMRGSLYTRCQSSTSNAWVRKNLLLTTELWGPFWGEKRENVVYDFFPFFFFFTWGYLGHIQRSF